jgi:hypothetical protein
MRILRWRDRVATPWKNGGGTTAQIATHPPGAALNDFDWRVSVADVREGGPFSRFDGIDRKLALLKGALSLTIEGRGTIALTPESPPLEFSGDMKTEAVLMSDAAQDLNVMTRRGVAISTMTREKSGGALTAEAPVCFAYFLSNAIISGGRDEFVLEAGDAVMFAPDDALKLSAVAEFYRMEIFAASC